MPCLTDAQIERLAGGRCDEAEGRQFKDHTDGCGECSRRLAERMAASQPPGIPSISGLDTAALASCLKGDIDAGEPSEPDPASTSDESMPSIPGYDPVHRIHEGGQGVVWLAVQRAARRKVAIKVMKEGPFASRKDVARFEREVEILGQLNHRNLVAIHDSGMASGRFYYVMDYISGQSLKDWIAGKERTIEEILRLFLGICEAVNAAHLRGVIHRDLKPGNIQIDPDGQPHILDFGLAKVAEGVDASMMTMTGQFVGTLPYASPEQAEGAPSRIDTRTDVYSLGVILYQMLTGRFPYEVFGSRREVENHIINTPPVAPSAVRREINNEIDTIVLTCLHKEPKDRYQTAGELARDVRHYLNGEPIDAKREKALYLLRIKLRRYRVRVGVAAGFVLLLATALLVSLNLLQRVADERDRAVLAEKAANEARESADRQRSLAQDRELAARASYAAAALEQGTAMHLAGRGQESREAFIRARDALAGLGAPTLPAEAGLCHSYRDFEAPINTLSGHSDGLMAVAWLPDKARAVSASEDATIRLWDVRTGRESRTFTGHRGAVNCLAVSADGRYVLSGGDDQTVRLWNVETAREERPSFRQTAPVRGVAFSHDGRFALAAAAEPGHALRMWNIENGTLVRLFETPDKEAYYGVAYAPDDRSILATTYERNVWIWDTATGRVRQRLSGHSSYVIAAAFSTDGSQVLSASFDQTIRLWNAETGAAIRELRGHTAGVRGVAFLDRDGKALSGSMDGSLRLWDLKTGELCRVFAGHTDGVRGLDVAPGGCRAISAGIDRTLRVWDLTQNAEAPSAAEAGTVTGLACSPDGMTFVSGDSSGSVTLRDLATFRVLRAFEGHAMPIDAVALLPDGRRLFAADSIGNCRVWDVRSGRELCGFRGQGPGEGRYLRGGSWCFTSVSPDGRFVLSSRPDHTMDLRDIESGAVIRTLASDCNRHITAVTISPDSRHALSGDEGGEMHYWDLESGRCLFSAAVGPKPGSVDCIAFSADGAQALTGGHELVVRLWDLTVPCQVREYVGPTLVVRAIGFGRGERTVFAVGSDQTLRVWDMQTGRELGLGAELTMYGYSLAVVPVGDAVLAGSGSLISLWDISRVKRYLDLEPRLESARSVLRLDPDDGPALARLGEWYAFRGVNDWAVDLLVRARAHGADVSPLTLARCYWQLGRLADAAREFRNALAGKEAPADYLELCLAAVTPASSAANR